MIDAPADSLWPPRLALSHDPCWRQYWRWGWERLPLSLPACLVEAEQHPLDADGLSVTVCLDRGIPVVCRVDDDEGRVLVEVLPEPPTGAADHRPVTSTTTWRAAELPSGIGLGFDWVFFVPIRKYQPTKPLGIVQTAVDRLLGSELVISIRRKPPVIF